MDTNALRMDMRVRLLGVVLSAVALGGCTLKEQEAPGLSGPSGLSLSLSIAAAPDRLVQDGVSQTRVTATARNAQGEPVSGQGITWFVTTSDGTQVEPVTQSSVTNAQGQASTLVTAPAAPAEVPSSPLKLRVAAQAQGSDTSTTGPGWERDRVTVEVELVPPAGTPTANRAPVAAFTIAPAVGNINQDVTFDASATTDEGVACDSRCNYLWDFGDFTTANGKIVTHKFTLPDSYTITLTVTDGRGGVNATTRPLTINGPAAPRASFSVLPSSPTAGVSAVLDGSPSTVGAGATISSYAWNFGDGSTATTTSPATNHTWAAASTYPVVLTVTDSLGRTATQTLVITVQ
jgi:PKD repeat protein